MCRRLRVLREEKLLTQSDVAEKLGVSQAAYSRLEKGEIEVSLNKLIKLSELYGLSLAVLLEGV
jgi:transcriptional regulator with XRE-family HTH domain